jgi:DNA-binding NarL/FixJ family response regulator
MSNQTQFIDSVTALPVMTVNLPPPGNRLSPRERQLLFLLGEGKTIKEAAHAMGIAWTTAGEYSKTLYRKLNVTKRSEMVRWLMHNLPSHPV